MKSKRIISRNFTGIDRAQKIIFSYPLVLNFYVRGGGLDRFDMIEPIVFGLQSTRPLTRLGRTSFSNMIEYFLNHDRESQMLDSEYCVIWMDWLEWINDPFVFTQILNWGIKNGIDSIPIEETVAVEPYNQYSFLIKVNK